MRMTDGNRTIEITMQEYHAGMWLPEWSEEFFGADFDCDKNVYVVDDVELAIEQAKDWKNGNGDYADERLDREEMGMHFDPDDRIVKVIEC